ncbi:DUF2752 domain-containing protein [Mucilaginibacter sp. UR6-11]|uniref:DUF2752 domain-containing protein n=1 Tax=Mucilaginibacter sp. UR6-11 TaxID=1435644 RepID=UPI001E3282D5|nr:DUF2752 domain-containing protein [Mucilaginibacter sp. UR6-11]MCC8425200.1 DUF2752 domain-containing protein [Mucilaginibacter sp. UR6-11]
MPFINWLQNHLLPCPFKWLTGIDCPGCGFQRAVIALLKGNVHESFLLYPPAIPLLLILACYLAAGYAGSINYSTILKRRLIILAGVIILISYCIKMPGLYHNYALSAPAAR